MLDQSEKRVAIIMMKRASCSGEESASVASVILKLEAWYNSAAAVEAAKAPPKKAAKDEGKPEKKVRDK